MGKYWNFLLTLLVFLATQALGSIALIGISRAQHCPFEALPIPVLALVLIAANVLAVLLCRFALHNIQFHTAFDITAIDWRQGSLGLAAGVLGITSISILTETLDSPAYLIQTSIALANSTWGVLTLVLVGPVAEELIFREALIGGMLRRSIRPWVAILASATAFGAIHANLAQSLYALPIGILFGIIYCQTGRIVLTTLLHILNNALVVIQLRRLGQDAFHASITDWLGSPILANTTMAVTGILSIVLTIVFWRSYSNLQPKHRHRQKHKIVRYFY